MKNHAGHGVQMQDAYQRRHHDCLTSDKHISCHIKQLVAVAYFNV